MSTPSARPPVVSLEEWDRARFALLDLEKAHTRAGDAVAAARRRMPMTPVAPATVVGAEGPVPFTDLFEGFDELVVYRHMWHHGKPIEDQCEGCTITIWNFQDAAYLRARGVGFAVLCAGPYEELAPFREFMGYTHPWYSTHQVDDPLVAGQGGGEIACYLRDGDDVWLTYETTGRGVEPIMGSLQLLDMTPYGRGEQWEDSPEGWPQGPAYAFWRTDGRPTAQWTRPGATPLGTGEP